jgi:hypothetical protein
MLKQVGLEKYGRRPGSGAGSVNFTESLSLDMSSGVTIRPPR